MHSSSVTIALLIATLLSVTGCSQRIADRQERRDEVLAKYFTDEAATVLASIPLRSISGNETKYRGIAIGDEPITRLWGVILGLGDARQVVVSDEHLDDDGLIVHEYLHQADYSGLIDRRAFVDQFAVLRTDPDHADYAARRANSILKSYGGSFFGQAELVLFDGLNTELVAFVGKDIATGELVAPPYLWDVYSQTLRAPDAGSAVPLELAEAAE